MINLTESVDQTASESADANGGDSIVVEPSSNESEQVMVDAPTAPPIPSANMNARVKLQVARVLGWL